MITNIILLGLLGLCFGSFIHAVVWRIHKGRDFVKERSECEHCHHPLVTADLVPVFSWLFLGGKCRYCKKPILWHHPAIELAVGTLFVISYVVWPPLVTLQDWAIFIAWLAYIVGLVGLFIYDLRWMILPNEIVFSLMAIGLVDVIIRLATTPNTSLVDVAQYFVFGLMSIGGLYGALYFISKGKWVGFGDVKLGLFMGLVLGWERGLLALMLANVIGFLVVVPGLLTKRLNRQSKVPFGPFLIVAFLIAGLFGHAIIQWYLNDLVLRTI